MAQFRRHLNVTLFLVWLLSTVLVYAGMVTMNTTLNPTFFYVCVGVAAIAMLGTEVWYLRQKDRSIAWLLINLLTWIGLIVLLSLENRSGDAALPEDECDTCVFSGEGVCRAPGSPTHNDGVCSSWKLDGAEVREEVAA